MTEGRKKTDEEINVGLDSGGIALLTMLLLFTAAVAENVQIPILIDGVLSPEDQEVLFGE